MKKFLLIISFVVSLFAFSTQVFSATIVSAYIMGQSIGGGNHSLVGAGMDTVNPGSTQTVAVGTFNHTMQWSNGYTDNGVLYDQWWKMGPGIDPWDPSQHINPKTLENNTATFQSGTDFVTATIPVDGFFIMPATYDFNTSGGTFQNPTISWKNDWAADNTNPALTRYQVRVFQEDGVMVFDKKLYGNLDQVQQSFSFLNEFDFLVGTNYSIRVEARKNIDLSPTSGSTGWIGIINRDVASMNYSSVPIPGAILLFGSGLLGLAGLRRRKRGSG